jgi:hypothetical protein
MWRRHSGDLLGEGPPTALIVVAEEPAHSQSNQRWSARDRRVIDLAYVSTVHPVRGAATRRTSHIGGDGVGVDDDSRCPAFNLVNPDADQMREQPAGERFKITFLR